MSDILRDLLEADARGVCPPQNWTSRAADEITRLRAALSAPPPVVPAREVARQVFEVCEDYEATPETPGDSQEVERFKAGVRFAAKRIRGAIGTWLTDEELSARAAAPQAPTQREGA